MNVTTCNNNNHAQCSYLKKVWFQNRRAKWRKHDKTGSSMGSSSTSNYPSLTHVSASVVPSVGHLNHNASGSSPPSPPSSSALNHLHHLNHHHHLNHQSSHPLSHHVPSSSSGGSPSSSSNHLNNHSSSSHPNNGNSSNNNPSGGLSPVEAAAGPGSPLSAYMNMSHPQFRPPPGLSTLTPGHLIRPWPMTAQTFWYDFFYKFFNESRRPN